jgi:hypothetical protein
MYSKMRAKRASQRSCYTYLTRPDRTRPETGTVSCDQSRDRDRDQYRDRDRDRIRPGPDQTRPDQDRTCHVTIHSPAKSRIILRNQTQRQQTVDSNQTRNQEPRTGNVKRQGDWAKEIAFRIGVTLYMYSSNPQPLYI